VTFLKDMKLSNTITKALDECYDVASHNVKTRNSIQDKLPKLIKERIDNWKFGEYGWISPVNIMMTAAWYKWKNPKQDVCLIWAETSQQENIPGGFSIRTQDENYTVPFLTKFRLASGFASPNSGMQGSRALEKNNLRDKKMRIGRNDDLEQRVKFDLKLFQNIMNDINESDATTAKNIFIYFVEKAIEHQNKKNIERTKLKKIPKQQIDNTKEIVTNAISTFKDPQFVKTVVVAIADELIQVSSVYQGCSILGIDGSKTAADARANTPGDFWIIDSSKEVIVAFEVKDQTKTIGFDVLAAIQSRIETYPNLQYYLLVGAGKIAVTNENKNDPQWKKMLQEYESQGVKVYDATVTTLLNTLDFMSQGKHHLLSSISKHLADTKDLKKDTIKKWIDLITN